MSLSVLFKLFVPHGKIQIIRTEEYFEKYNYHFPCPGLLLWYTGRRIPLKMVTYAGILEREYPYILYLYEESR